MLGYFFSSLKFHDFDRHYIRSYLKTKEKKIASGLVWFVLF